MTHMSHHLSKTGKQSCHSTTCARTNLIDVFVVGKQCGFTSHNKSPIQYIDSLDSAPIPETVDVSTKISLWNFKSRLNYVLNVILFTCSCHSNNECLGVDCLACVPKIVAGQVVAQDPPAIGRSQQAQTRSQFLQRQNH